MADFATLRAKIVLKVKGITSKLEADAVYDHEVDPTTITKDPFAIVVPSGNANDFISTSENRRVYAFIVSIYMERKNRGPDNAEEALESIVDDLLDDFDEDFTLGGTALLVRAAPSRWGYTQGEKEYRVAEITIQAMTDFTAVS